MCRNIKPLFNFDPLATEEEIRAASLQYVRKVSGFNKPSETNSLAFENAVNEITLITQNLLGQLETTAQPKNREIEIEKSRVRNLKRFGAKID